jgi:hypothetical protein
MIWDNPTDIFFSLNSSTGDVQGNKHYTNALTGNADYFNKIIEHEKVIYIWFSKSGTL